MLEIQPPLRTVICYVPFQDSEDVFVRTGASGDGNCFFHSLLRAIDGDYKNDSYETQLSKVENIRNFIAEHITQDIYTSLGNGEHRRLLFFASFRRYLEHPFRGEAFENIALKLTNLEKAFEEACSSSTQKNFYHTFWSKVQAQIREQVKEITALERISKKIETWCRNTFLQAYNQAFQKFVESIRAMNTDVEAVHMECIAKVLEKNFIFLREVDGVVQPYQEITSLDYPTLVFLWIQDCHYEIIGRYEKNKSVTRLFDNNDVWIKKIQQK